MSVMPDSPKARIMTTCGAGFVFLVVLTSADIMPSYAQPRYLEEIERISQAYLVQVTGRIEDVQKTQAGIMLQVVPHKTRHPLATAEAEEMTALKDESVAGAEGEYRRNTLKFPWGGSQQAKVNILVDRNTRITDGTKTLTSDVLTTTTRVKIVYEQSKLGMLRAHSVTIM